MNLHAYLCYGLRIHSELQLPELCKCDLPVTSEPDVEVRLGDVPEKLSGARKATPWLQHTHDQCVIRVADYARMHVEKGTRITVDRHLYLKKANAARQRDTRLYLLGTGFAAILHQRQWLPLHVSAVESQGGAVAFTGSSGAGKSTIAAWLHFRFGLPLLADDVAVIRPKDKQLNLHPGPPRLKLWDDSISKLGLERDGMVRDLSRKNKFHLPNFVNENIEALPLTHLVVLRKSNPGTSVQLEEVHGVEAYQSIMRTIYRTVLCKIFYDQAQLHVDGGALVRKIRIFTLDRPLEWKSINPTLQYLMERLRAIGGTS